MEDYGKLVENGWYAASRTPMKCICGHEYKSKEDKPFIYIDIKRELPHNALGGRMGSDSILLYICPVCGTVKVD